MKYTSRDICVKFTIMNYALIVYSTLNNLILNTHEDGLLLFYKIT